jgi:2Fe-2S iron-sulfur cluster protein
MARIQFRLNGVKTMIDADPNPSMTILRGELGMGGTHFGCGSGECGACNVMIGDYAAACETPLWSVADKDVMTVEGLGSAERPHVLQRALNRRASAPMRVLHFGNPDGFTIAERMRTRDHVCRRRDCGGRKPAAGASAHRSPDQPPSFANCGPGRIRQRMNHLSCERGGTTWRES